MFAFLVAPDENTAAMAEGRDASKIAHAKRDNEINLNAGFDVDASGVTKSRYDVLVQRNGYVLIGVCVLAVTVVALIISMCVVNAATSRKLAAIDEANRQSVETLSALLDSLNVTVSIVDTKVDNNGVMVDELLDELAGDNERLQDELDETRHDLEETIDNKTNAVMQTVTSEMDRKLTQTIDRMNATEQQMERRIMAAMNASIGATSARLYEVVRGTIFSFNFTEMSARLKQIRLPVKLHVSDDVTGVPMELIVVLRYADHPEVDITFDCHNKSETDFQWPLKQSIEFSLVRFDSSQFARKRFHPTEMPGCIDPEHYNGLPGGKKLIFNVSTLRNENVIYDDYFHVRLARLTAVVE